MALFVVTQHFSNILLILLLLSSFISAHTQNNASSSTTTRILKLHVDDNPQPRKKKSISIIDDDNNPQPINKKSYSNSLSTSNNQTKLTTASSKNQTKLVKTKLSLSDSVSVSTKKKIKLTPEEKLALKSQLKKLNSTSTKSSDLYKTTTKKNLNESKSKNSTKSQSSTKKKDSNSQPYWLQNDEDDLTTGLTDLPSKFQETLLPDLEKISKTSTVYLNKANKQITNNFKPIVGNKYASTIASITSFTFILIPLILVSLIFNKIKAYFSLQRLLIFIQIYLSIYFSILCLSSLLTGLEPLKFFYATSQSTYICLQLLQTLAYVLYLLMLLMYLVLVFSTSTGPVTKMIGLTQTFVGFAVGLHYYMTVFHKALLRQPPKTSWRIHAIYATCFLLICLLNRAEKMKKTYLQEGGEEGKMN
ncbi:uncharacterized protein LOC107016203 [Solanum pennellii]|uniref:Uncharacterized protein LOC107016203 n=1 Tax=Solanum pennellii TaxID=28526 RepID=A0ABM1GK65_SOLPN|nr:uncharacterized protein LOC107016203 [Solanum pennellii]